MTIHAYTIHWRQLVAVWVPSAVGFLIARAIRGDADKGVHWWLIFNLWMVLVLLLSIRREQQGLSDDWPESEPGTFPYAGDYLRYRGGPLDGRPVPIRGELVGCEIVNSATMLLPQIEIPEGRYTLNREKKRYDWSGTTGVSTSATPGSR